MDWCVELELRREGARVCTYVAEPRMSLLATPKMEFNSFLNHGISSKLIILVSTESEEHL